MRRIADIARTLLKFIGRGLALAGRVLGAPTPFRLLGPLPLQGSWYRASEGDRR